jgi:hypothetical protein
MKRCDMKKEVRIALGLAVVVVFVLVLLTGAFAQKKAPESMMLKLEGAKSLPCPSPIPCIRKRRR